MNMKIATVAVYQFDICSNQLQNKLTDSFLPNASLKTHM